MKLIVHTVMALVLIAVCAAKGPCSIRKLKGDASQCAPTKSNRSGVSKAGRTDGSVSSILPANPALPAGMLLEVFSSERPYKQGNSYYESLCSWREPWMVTLTPRFREMLEKNNIKAAMWMCTTHIPGTGTDLDGPEIIRFAGIFIVDKSVPSLPHIMPEWDTSGNYTSDNLVIVGFQEPVNEHTDCVSPFDLAAMVQRAFLEVIGQGE